MKLFLARHGETDWNQQKMIQGPNSSHLSEKGKQQARALKEHLSSHPAKIFKQSTNRHTDGAVE
jgi:broad specificity phosphatase PhoE